jgi:pimeloyl-ACP methyl ester carboxylesterase
LSVDEQRATTSDGQTFVFADQGRGPLVVLLHGFPDTPASWDRIAARLVDDGYRAVVPWLRGYHPDTIVEGLGYGAEAIAGDPIRLLDALGEPSAVLVGHDWGASMAYGAANLAPERFRAIVPIDIPHPSLVKPNPKAAWTVRHFLALKMPWADRAVARNDLAYIDTLYRRWAPAWSGPDRDQAVADAKACFRDQRCLHGAIDYYRALSPRVPPSLAHPPAVPGLIVGGTLMIEPAAYAATAEAMGEGSDSLVIDGVGHWPHREAEDRFLARLLDFLASLP